MNELKTPEMEQAEFNANEAWKAVVDLWRIHKANTDAVMVKPHNKPTEESLKKWIVSTNGLFANASEAYDKAIGANADWVKAVNHR